MFLSPFFNKSNQRFSFVTASIFWCFQILLFITVVCVFVPFLPLMPSEGLDPSWMFGMNQAVAQGLVFGKDIVFTYGPYASIFTKMYHPETDSLMIYGSLYLAMSYGTVLFLVTRQSNLYLLVALCLVLTGLMYTRSTLIYSYPLLVGIFCFKLVTLQINIRSVDRFSPVFIFVLFSPLGLLVLIKGTFLILSGVVTLFSIILFYFNKRTVLAAAVTVAPILSLILFWFLSGQAVLDIPSYFITMLPIASGYTDAMSINGNELEIYFYIVGVLVILFSLLRDTQLRINHRLFILFIFFLYFFIVFKGTFVRHNGQATLAATSLLLASLFYAISVGSRRSVGALLLCAFVWMGIDSNHTRTSTKSFLKNSSSTYVDTWDGINIRLNRRDFLENNFNNAIQNIIQKVKIPLFKGTTDMYSYDQAYLFASGNVWNPRPILQSYSAYTPSLIEMNKDHLLGVTSPDNIIFKVKPIDGRLPSIEDGASWLPLLTSYYPGGLENDFLYLHKNNKNNKNNVVIPKDYLMNKKSYFFGELVPVPSGSTPVFAEIIIDKSPLGHLANMFFKPSHLKISLNTENGRSKAYRIISGMSSSGILISPLIENTAEFGMLYGGVDYLPGKTVKSFSIDAVSNRDEWKGTYEVVFKEVVIPLQVDMSQTFKFEKVLTSIESREIFVAKKCYGSIDSINGSVTNPVRFSATSILSINGWLANSVDQGYIPTSVLLVLKDDKGNNKFLHTRRILRPDVGAHFKKPILDSSGYTSTADVSDIVGEYSIGLALIEGNNIKICPQFSIQGVFNGTVSL